MTIMQKIMQIIRLAGTLQLLLNLSANFHNVLSGEMDCNDPLPSLEHKEDPRYEIYSHHFVTSLFMCFQTG